MNEHGAGLSPCLGASTGWDTAPGTSGLCHSALGSPFTQGSAAFPHQCHVHGHTRRSKAHQERGSRQGHPHEPRERTGARSLVLSQGAGFIPHPAISTRKHLAGAGSAPAPLCAPGLLPGSSAPPRAASVWGPGAHSPRDGADRLLRTLLPAPDPALELPGFPPPALPCCQHLHCWRRAHATAPRRPHEILSRESGCFWPGSRNTNTGSFPGNRLRFLPSREARSHHKWPNPAGMDLTSSGSLKLAGRLHWSSLGSISGVLPPPSSRWRAPSPFPKRSQMIPQAETSLLSQVQLGFGSGMSRVGRAGPGGSPLRGDTEGREPDVEIHNLQLLKSINSSRSKGQMSSSDGTSVFIGAGRFQPNLPRHQCLAAARTLLQPLPVPR